MFENIKITNIDSLYTAMINILTPKFGRNEAREIVRLIFLDLKGWSASDIIVNGNISVSDYLLECIEKIITRIMNDEPVQYVTGKAHFHGLTFDVNPSVLIPRPETDALVDMIIDENDRPDLKILDIGTGSGCIAISLARSLPFCDVTAIDISPRAIETASKNSVRLKTNVNFIVADIFKKDDFGNDEFDIIVSNPPYIDDKEKSGMDRNVLEYEPHSALFVPDDDPIRFYIRIGLIASKSLKKGGKLYFEINPLHHIEICEYLSGLDFVDIKVIKDYFGKDRFISATRG